MSKVEVLRVSSTTMVGKLAGSISTVIRRDKACITESIGAEAVNQTTKAIVISRGQLAPEGIELVCIPSFFKKEIDGEIRTGIKHLIKEVQL